MEKTHFGERDAARKNKYSKFLCANHSDEPLGAGIMFGSIVGSFSVFVPIDSITLFVWILGQSLDILLFLFQDRIQSESYDVSDP